MTSHLHADSGDVCCERHSPVPLQLLLQSRLPRRAQLGAFFARICIEDQ